MVILDVKRSEKKNEFLFETTVKVKVSDLLRELCDVHNLRLKVLRLALCCKELAKHGPIRPEETRGISSDLSKVSELDVNAYGKPSNPDEHSALAALRHRKSQMCFAGQQRRQRPPSLWPLCRTSGRWTDRRAKLRSTTCGVRS